MSKHVIVGAGQVGGGLAALLAEQGHEVVVVTRSGSGPDVEGVTKIAADASDAGRLTDITKGAAVLFNCANPPYHRWAQEWPPLAAALMAAAEATGAGLVNLGNLYVYGPVDQPMTEELPLAAPGTKGRVRATMWNDMLAAHRAGRIRVTELRGSDYFGPGTLAQSHLGPRFVGPLLTGKRASFFGNPDLPHSWTYVPDVIRALAIAGGGDDRIWGRAWHIPTAPATPARAVAEQITTLAGTRTPRVTSVPKWVVNALGLVSPLIRGLRETRYQFERPYILDSTDFETTFGMRPTPLAEAIRQTVTDQQR